MFMSMLYVSTNIAQQCVVEETLSQDFLEFLKQTLQNF